jgi:uncharacterized protein YjbJ (UPF0337 family)
MSEKDTGPEAGVKGVIEGVKGKAKELIGAVTGRDELRREGEAQGEKASALRDVAVKEAEADKARIEAKGHEAEQRTHQD